MPNVNRTVTYDDNGNIAGITQGTDTVTYTYDLANELTEEQHGADGEVIRYVYDTYGNLLSRTSYASPADAAAETPQETLTYTYGNSSWKDQLTSCAVTTATGTATTSLPYDAMGNPTAIGNKSLTWEGKRLTAINTAAGQDPDITYAYDQNGLRLQKTVNGTTTDYHYNGTVLISQTTDSDTLLFSYDASGKAVSVRHLHTNADETVTTNDYYYLRNAQSDIIAIIDGIGTKVVEYT